MNRFLPLTILNRGASKAKEDFPVACEGALKTALVQLYRFGIHLMIDAFLSESGSVIDAAADLQLFCAAPEVRVRLQRFRNFPSGFVGTAMLARVRKDL